MSDSRPEEREALLALLEWYGEMGVDAALDDAPHDRFAESRAAALALPRIEPPASPIGPTPVPERARPTAAPVLSADATVLNARERAAQCGSLAELERALDAFDGCGLKKTASRLVFADGNPAARIMLVGEKPGAEEDRSGVPFVGRAGHLLDRMLAAIELTRQDVYIANIVPWRPPGNRTPTPHETATCLPFTERQIALVNPDILVCLGGPAAQTLLALKDGIMRARGRWSTYTIANDTPHARVIKGFTMLHPAYLLRQPAHKKLAWRDLRELKKGLTSAP